MGNQQLDLPLGRREDEVEDYTVRGQIICNVRLYAPIVLGAVIAVMVFSASVKKSADLRKKNIVSILRKTEQSLSVRKILNDNVAAILKLNRVCTKWRLIISETLVIIMENNKVKLSADYENIPTPLTVVGQLHSAILDPKINYNRFYRPQVIYMYSPEYPNEYFDEISRELNKLRIEFVKTKSFNVDKLHEKKSVPVCTSKIIKNFECYVCKKSLANPYWCEKCSIVAYCNDSCSSNDVYHHIVCPMLLEQSKIFSEDQKRFPFSNVDNLNTFLEHEDICKKLVIKELHGFSLFTRACGCFNSIIPLQLYAELSSLLCMSLNGENQKSIRYLGLEPHWNLLNDVPPSYYADSVDTWDKLYNCFKIPSSDLAYFIVYFPMTFWYIVIHVANKISSFSGTESNPKPVIKIHIANTDDEIDYLFLLRILARISSKFELQFFFFSDAVSTDMWLPYTRAAFLKDNEDGNYVVFSVVPSKYSKHFFYENANIKSPVIKQGLPDIVIALPPKEKSTPYLDDDLIESIKSEGKWLFILSNDFSTAETVLQKSLPKEEQIDYEIIHSQVNPFRRPGTLENPSQKEVPSWRLGYFSGFKRK